MAFAIFSRKKQPSIEDLIKEHGRLSGERERLSELIDETRRRAVLNGMSVDEARGELAKIEIETQLTETAQSEVRKRLVELVDARMRETLSELGTRKAELEQEMAEEAQRAGVLVGSAVNILKSLGTGFAGRLATDISASVEAALLAYASKPGLHVDFSKGMSEAPACETDYRREQKDLRVPFNGVPPSDPRWEHGIQQAVKKLLDEQDPPQRLFLYHGDGS